MIINAQTRPYRCQVETMGKRRVAARATGEMSPELRRAVIIALGIALALVVALGQYLHWRIMREVATAAALTSEFHILEEENANLLAQRTRLLSRQHVEAVAAVRLDLHAPASGQVHRL